MDVVRPKVDGAWNLHKSLLNHRLDFFIMLSSTSGVIGNRGQAAYAAANSFLDAFTHYRVSQGLPATAIDLGAVEEIGYIAERPELQGMLESQGPYNALNKADVLALVKLAVTGQIDQSANHQCTTGLNFDNYNPQDFAFSWATDARFSHLRPRAGAGASTSGGPDSAVPTKQALRQARDLDGATRVVADELTAKLASVLVIPLDEINIEKPVVAIGLDSLVAIEVRSWIARELNAAVSTMEMMTSPSLRMLVEIIVMRSKLLEGLRGKKATDADGAE